jgi:hypothetical protein
MYEYQEYDRKNFQDQTAGRRANFTLMIDTARAAWVNFVVTVWSPDGGLSFSISQGGRFPRGPGASSEDQEAALWRLRVILLSVFFHST